MAFQHADPAPFIPEGMQHEDIPNHVFIMRAIAPIRPLARNEDLAIATFNLLPPNEMQFAAVRAVLRDFLRFERPTVFLDIHPTYFGQALFRFNHAFDLDTIVAKSPTSMGMSRFVSTSIMKDATGVEPSSTMNVGCSCWDCQMTTGPRGTFIV